MVLRAAILSEDESVCNGISNTLVAFSVGNDFEGQEIELDIAKYGTKVQNFLDAYKDIDISFITYDILDAFPMVANELFSLNPMSYPVMLGTPENRICSFLAIRPAGHMEHYGENEKLKSVCNACLNMLARGNHVLHIKTRQGSYAISVKSIIFCQSDQKYISIVTDTGKIYRKLGKLNQFAEGLPSEFLRVHQSFLINSRHVVELDKVTWELITDTGYRVPVSRVYHQTALNIFQKMSFERSNMN